MGLSAHSVILEYPFGGRVDYCNVHSLFLVVFVCCGISWSNQGFYDCLKLRIAFSLIMSLMLVLRYIVGSVISGL